MATRVGVGHGTDLLLYFLVLIFVCFVATTYHRFRQIEGDVTHLARQFALLEETRSSWKTSPRAYGSKGD